MDIKQQCKDLYEKHKHLKIVGEILGISWQAVYVHLRELGVPVTGDKKRYGSATDKFAARAESLFQSLCPDAEDMNRKKFQAKYDFLVYGMKVDVKASSLNSSSKKCKLKRWAFSVKKQETAADFMVCMAYDGNGEKLQHIFLYPGELIRFMSTISISEALSGKWADYQIEPTELQSFFKQLKKRAA